MSYYVFTIEQVKADEGYSEYAATPKKYSDQQSAEVHFYQRCAEVSNALGKTHTWMDIRIVNSVGTLLKKDQIGQYQESV
jgi:hypothetical protein